MTFADAIVILVLIAYAVAGYFRGFLHTVGGLVGLAFTAGATWLLFRPLAAMFRPNARTPLAPAFAFLVLLVLTYTVTTLALRRFYRSIPEATRVSPGNRALGVLPGILDGLVMLALLITLLVQLPSTRVPRESIRRSLLARPLLQAGTRAQMAAFEAFGPSLETLLPLRVVEPSAKSRVLLPYTTDEGVPDPGMERELARTVNTERLQRGLKALAWDDRLRDVARLHSRDMFTRGYFAHTSPEGDSALERVTARGLRFAEVGENLALAPTLNIAHTGLMRSPGHRANILYPRFQRIGIGIIVARPYGLMVTQLFAR